PARKILPCLLLALATSVSWAGEPDRHLDGDPASALYRSSTFVHGFIHGYEDGFKTADIVYQMALEQQDLEKFHQYREATTGYRREFGSKDDFRQGYREGFRSGYNDSLQNRSFRVVSAARQAAAGLKDPSGKGFESGLVSGYRAAQNSPTVESGLPCSAQSSQDSKPTNDGYCEGFSRGARFWRLAVAPSTESSHGVQTAAKH